MFCLYFKTRLIPLCKLELLLILDSLQNTFDGLILSGGPTAGRLELSLGFYAKSGTLKVLIIQCQDLPPVNSDGTANPFVKA